jgi:hypothetical protein
MLFARIQGSMEWCCPFCGHLNRSTLPYENSGRIRCNGSDCRRAMAVGLVFNQMTAGFKIPPVDSIMPIEVSTRKWRSGKPLNRLDATDNCDLVAWVTRRERES